MQCLAKASLSLPHCFPTSPWRQLAAWLPVFFLFCFVLFWFFCWITTFLMVSTLPMSPFWCMLVMFSSTVLLHINKGCELFAKGMISDGHLKPPSHGNPPTAAPRTGVSNKNSAPVGSRVEVQAARFPPSEVELCPERRKSAQGGPGHVKPHSTPQAVLRCQ